MTRLSGSALAGIKVHKRKHLLDGYSRFAGRDLSGSDGKATLMSPADQKKNTIPRVETKLRVFHFDFDILSLV